MSKPMTPWPALLVLLFVAFVAPAAVAEPQDSGSAQDSAESEEEQAYAEKIVVTASRTEQKLDDVPAAMTVIDSTELEEIPADDYGDYLRNVPGLNVSQMSARDVQITGRSATNSLATSQLVLLDNRSLYLDFFGFVMWDFAPLDPREIKQIEVVRGPGSAVWGANAMTGVVNIITKSPKENPGTTVMLGGGELGTVNGSVTHTGVAGKLGYRLEASYYEQEAYDRPSGTIPGTEGPTNPGGTPYPDFENQGTKQPKVNVRFDYDQNDEITWSFSSGYAETDGIIHSGIGPFDIASGTSLSYFKADWKRRAARVTFFTNVLDGDADNLLTRGPTGDPLAFLFESETYNLDFSNNKIFGGRHILTYGATARHNSFDLSIAPAGDSRDEFGVFVQDEILFGERVRWLIGGRWDDLDPIGSVFSPRTSLLFKVRPDHTLRFSYNRAFRAPSMVQNFLEITFIPSAVDLSALGGPAAFPIVSQATGNEDLTEEQLDAFEIGYVGTFGRTVFTASVYRNELQDSIDFFEAAAYDSANPPPGWGQTGIPVMFLDFPPLAGALPALFSYRNIGEIVDQGVELSINVNPSTAWSCFVNYSWQDEPDVSGIDQETLPNGNIIDAVNQPPEHRVNLGAAYTGKRFHASANLNWVDQAFWTDVLNSSFWGSTDTYTMINVNVGFDFNEKVSLSVNAQNAFDDEVMQHVFGDIISRKVSGQLLLRF